MFGTTVDPLLLAGSHARLVTVSERYAEELLGERDPEMSGGLGRALREKGSPCPASPTASIRSPMIRGRLERAGLPFASTRRKGISPGRTNAGKPSPTGSPATRVRTGTPVRIRGQAHRTKGGRCPHRGGSTDSGGIPGARGSSVLGQGREGGELAELAEDPATHGRLVFLPATTATRVADLWGERFFPDPVRVRALRAHGFHRPAHGQHSGRSPRRGTLQGPRRETGFTYGEHIAAALAAAIEPSRRSLLRRSRGLSSASVERPLPRFCSLIRGQGACRFVSSPLRAADSGGAWTAK